MEVPKGDFGYRLNFTVKDSAGTVFPLTGYTVALKVWKEGIAGTVFNGACSILVAANGTCYYDVVAGDFNTVGSFLAKLEFTKSGEKSSTADFEFLVLESA